MIIVSFQPACADPSGLPVRLYAMNCPAASSWGSPCDHQADVAAANGESHPWIVVEEAVAEIENPAHRFALPRGKPFTPAPSRDLSRQSLQLSNLQNLQQEETRLMPRSPTFTYPALNSPALTRAHSRFAFRGPSPSVQKVPLYLDRRHSGRADAAYPSGEVS